MKLDVYGESLCALVASAALASTGHRVVLHMPEGDARTGVLAGDCPFREPGLSEFLIEQQAAGRLQLADFAALPDSEEAVIWLALLPGQFDFAQRLLARLPVHPQRLVVNQSTFPVGSSELLQQALNSAHADASGAVVALPDLLTEGGALQGFLRAEQWLLGGEADWALGLTTELLRPYNRRRDNIQRMRSREAEFTKLAITGMLATRLSYMNDMANLADVLDVDIERVRQGMGADARIGEAYLYPGCGFGGLKFSRDVMSLAETLVEGGMPARLLDEVLRINERQKELLFRKLWQHYRADLKGRKVAIWGGAFKPESARIDNAPVLPLLEALWAQGVEVHVHDPRALPALRAWAGERADLVLHEDPYAALEGVDALLLVTEWKPFWSPDFPRMRAAMREPVLLDGRNIWDPLFVQQSGFVYYGIGRH